MCHDDCLYRLTIIGTELNKISVLSFLRLDSSADGERCHSFSIFGKGLRGWQTPATMERDGSMRFREELVICHLLLSHSEYGLI